MSKLFLIGLYKQLYRGGGGGGGGKTPIILSPISIFGSKWFNGAKKSKKNMTETVAHLIGRLLPNISHKYR